MTQPVDTAVSGGFDPERYEWRDHLKTAVDDMKEKIRDIDIAWDYYNGDHPKVWITEALKEMFDDILADDMVENWCDEAVNQPLMRLRVTGWDGQTEIHANAADNIFDDNSLDLAQLDLYRHMFIAGEGFAFLWKDPEKPAGIDVTIKDPRHVWWPSDAHRTDPRHVVLIWADMDEQVWRATLYYTVDVVRLVGPKVKGKGDTMPEAGAFKLDEDDPGGEHGFDKVPVVRFADQLDRTSKLKNLIPIQNRINKLVSQLMISGEFNAYRKLVIMSTQNVDEKDLRIRPNRALILDPGGDSQSGVAPTSIWEGSATELSNFDNSLARQVEKFFSKVPLPRHILVQQGILVSGDAIEADEGPFVEMVEFVQGFLGASWKDLYAILGIDVKPQWRNPAVRSDKSEAEVVKIFKDAGIPIELVLKKYAGWSTEEIKELTDRPMSTGEMASALTALGTGVALGGIDPEAAKQVTGKMLGGGQNEGSTGSGPKPQPPPQPTANA